MSTNSVVFVHNIWTPYRAPLFGAVESVLSTEVGDGAFSVLYMGQTEERRLWTTPEAVHLRPWESYSNGLWIRLGRRSWRWNPGMLRTLAAKDPAVVVITGLGSLTSLQLLAWATATGRKVVLWDETCGLGPLASEPEWELNIKRFLARRCAKVMVPGRAALDYQINTLRVPAERVTMVGDAVPRDLFYVRPVDRCVRSKSVALGEIPGNILYVGDISSQKGIPLLIEAFKQHRALNSEWTLTLVGEGPLRQDLLDEHIAGVHLPGYVQSCGLGDYYAQADLFVMPTLKDVWGLVVNEAMTAGLPVVCSDLAGCHRDIVTQDTGVLFNPMSTEQLLAALLSLTADSPRRLEMGLAGQRLILESMSIENAGTRMADALWAVFGLRGGSQ